MPGNKYFSSWLLILAFLPAPLLAQENIQSSTEEATKAASSASTVVDTAAQAGAASEFKEGHGDGFADDFSSAGEGENSDPWEGLNRTIFRFNDGADRWVLKPVATTYQKVTPNFIRLGIGNFFSNLGETTNAANNVLQWKWGEASRNSGRFLINSTLGLVGLFDVAKHVGLEPGDGEDFGQTLAVWGVGSGPYIMLPLLGPTTLRAIPARVVDHFTAPLNYVDDQHVNWDIDGDDLRWGLRGVDITRSRADVLEQEKLLRGDRYMLIRGAYLQRREYLIKDGVVEDDFGSDFDDEDF